MQKSAAEMLVRIERGGDASSVSGASLDTSVCGTDAGDEDAADFAGVLRGLGGRGGRSRSRADGRGGWLAGWLARWLPG